MEHRDQADPRLPQGDSTTSSSSIRSWTSAWARDGNNTFAPAAKVARKINENLSFGFEYYTDLGPIQALLPFNEQQHNLYAVVDFKVGRFDVNAGVGYGLTPGSDRLMAKMIIGTDLNEPEPSKPGQTLKSVRMMNGPRP